MNKKGILKSVLLSITITAAIGASAAAAEVNTTNIGVEAGAFGIVPAPQMTVTSSAYIDQNALSADTAVIDGSEYLFVSTQNGIKVLDVTNKKNGIAPTDVTPENNACYVTSPYSAGSSEVSYYAIQNPDQNFSFGTVKAVKAADGNTYLYYSCIVTDDSNGDGSYDVSKTDHHAPCIRKINVTNPKSPVFVKDYRGKVTSNYSANSFRYNYLKVEDNKIYAFGVDYKNVHNDQPAVSVFDETSAADEADGFYYPSEYYDYKYGNALCAFYGDSFARTKSDGSNIRVAVGKFDVDDNGKKIVSEIVSDSLIPFNGNFRDRVRGIEFNGKYVFVSVKNNSSAQNGIYVYELSENALTLKTIYHLGDDIDDSISEIMLDRMDLIGNTLYVAAEVPGLISVDVSDMEKPVLTSFSKTKRFVYSIFASDNSVYGAGGSAFVRWNTLASGMISASDYGQSAYYIRPDYFTFNKGEQDAKYSAITAVYDKAGNLVNVIHKMDYTAAAGKLAAGEDQGRVNAWFTSLKDDPDLKTYTFKTFMWTKDGMQPLMTALTEKIN